MLKLLQRVNQLHLNLKKKAATKEKPICQATVGTHILVYHLTYFTNVKNVQQSFLKVVKKLILYQALLT